MAKVPIFQISTSSLEFGNNKHVLDAVIKIILLPWLFISASLGNVPAYSLDFLGNIMSETFSGGTLNGIALSRGLDHFLRVTNISVNSTPSASQAYTYDAASRLQSASMLGHSANYSYDTASGLIKTVGYQKWNFTRLTEGRGFDEFLRLNRLNYTNWAGTHMMASRSNVYNALSQISTIAFDGINSAIGYDGVGQIAGLTNKWADDTAPVAGQIWNFSFNDIGNRIGVDSGGDENGENLYNTDYNSDINNQYQSIYNSSAYQVMGEADAGTLNVNGSTSGVSRHGSYFHKQIYVTASGSGTQALVRVDLTNGSAYATPLSGSVYIPPAFEELTYTPKGNLLTDGRWTYRWDAWDRLTRLDRRNPFEPVERIEFEYDHLGRRIQKTVTFTNASIVSTKFIHDGWKLVAELDSSFNLVRSYLWGADLSQTKVGAAGVGGLVGINFQTNGFYFSASDGRGNVTGLIKPTVSAPAVRYDYSPFGELIRASGELADANPLRYSTKYFDDETGLIYFGHRYYHPAQGRWASPDPLEELGGLNLYGFVGNNPINLYDRNGLAPQLTSLSFRLDGNNFTPLGVNYSLDYSNEGSPVNNSYSEPTPGQTIVATILVSTVPGVGETMDGLVLADPDSAWWEKLLAATSLGANYATAGLAPNIGGIIKVTKEVCEEGANKTQRIFTSPDPLVADLANKIESLYPGHVVGVNVPLLNEAGSLLTDADILLQNSIIQVKSGGSAQGLLRQLQSSEVATGLPSIGFAPNLPGNSLRTLSRQSALVTDTEELLLQVVKP